MTMLTVLTIFICLVAVSGDIPAGSQCQPSTCGARAAPCSTNSDSSSFTPSTVVNSSYSSTWTTNSQTFARISGGVANYYYQAIRVIVNTSGNYNITSSSNVDTYGYLYATAFYPSNISLNLIAQDDDSGGSLQFEFARFFNSSVVYILVATAYSGGVMAPFSIIVSDPSRVSLLYINTTSVTPMNSTTATIASTTQGTTPLQTPAVAMSKLERL
ncbi:unnamed protein product [Rotaria socialis]|uniref:Uncharacterized protein n=1 Tax=Rotaria socialis TaxID=392032 RepID=A0A818QMD4_9BILA|nr:unnamed protein product [Rotaria socialis]